MPRPECTLTQIPSIPGLSTAPLSFVNLIYLTSLTNLDASSSVYFFTLVARNATVTKTSTEAELIAVSDSANHALYIRHFLLDQSHDTGPVTIYEGNTSTMALIARGKPGDNLSSDVIVRPDPLYPINHRYENIKSQLEWFDLCSENCSMDRQNEKQLIDHD